MLSKLTANGTRTPQAILCGSTNFTESGVYRQANVGHVVNDRTLATRYLELFETIWDAPDDVGAMRDWINENNPIDRTAAFFAGFSPRSGNADLARFIDIVSRSDRDVLFATALALPEYQACSASAVRRTRPLRKQHTRVIAKWKSNHEPPDRRHVSCCHQPARSAPVALCQGTPNLQDLERRIEAAKREQAALEEEARSAEQQKAAEAASMATLLIRSDSNCTLTIDGKPAASVESAKPATVTVSPGQHQPVCTSRDQSTVSRELVISARSGTQTVHSIAMAADLWILNSRDHSERAQDAKVQARCGNPAGNSACIVDEGNGVLRQPATGLQWTRSNSGTHLDWSAATSFCARKGAGWRLPSVKELQSLHEPTFTLRTKCGRLHCPVSGLIGLNDWLAALDDRARSLNGRIQGGLVLHSELERFESIVTRANQWHSRFGIMCARSLKGTDDRKRGVHTDCSAGCVQHVEAVTDAQSTITRDSHLHSMKRPKYGLRAAAASGIGRARFAGLGSRPVRGRLART